MNSKLTAQHREMLKSLIDVSQAYTIFCMQDLRKSPTLMSKLAERHLQILVDLGKDLKVEMLLIDRNGKSESLFTVHAEQKFDS